MKYLKLFLMTGLIVGFLAVFPEDVQACSCAKRVHGTCVKVKCKNDTFKRDPKTKKVTRTSPHKKKSRSRSTSRSSSGSSSSGRTTCRKTYSSRDYSSHSCNNGTSLSNYQNSGRNTGNTTYLRRDANGNTWEYKTYCSISRCYSVNRCRTCGGSSSSGGGSSRRRSSGSSGGGPTFPIPTSTPTPPPPGEPENPGDNAGDECAMPTSAHDGTYQDTTVELSWDPVEGAENYRVVVQDASTKTPTANSVTYALKPGTYTWRVRAENGSGNSEWTEWQDFEVKACPYIEVYDGDVHSQVEIDSDLLARVPAGYLLKGGNRGKEGVASSRNAPRIGNYSEENWVSQTDYSLITGPEYVSFDLLERKIPDHGSPPCGLGDKSCWEGAGLFEQDGEDNEAYYHVTGDLNTPDEEVEVTGDRKLILFVEDKIRIRGNIIMGPDAYLMLVSGGGIDIESDVTRVEGVYYTTGIINTKVD